MRGFAVLFALFLAGLFAVVPASAAPVLMISVDGLRPGDVLEAEARGLKIPTLRKLAADGAYATGVRNMLPTVTYPNHTTLITGVAPALHGISNNVVFDPLQKNNQGWYWYASDIKVPTLWDAVHAKHGVVASISWPASVGTSSIDDDVPEYWRTQIAEDLKLLKALCTPGLIDEMEKTPGVSLAATFSQEPEGDEGRARLMAAIIAAKHPQFTTLHLVSLDHYQHEYGPGAPEAHATLERIDAAIGGLLAEARRAEPDLIVAIVSDHGFAPISHAMNLAIPFIDAGLVTLDPVKHAPAAWEAEPWGAGGSAAVVLARPGDAALKAKVAALLAKLAADPANNIAQVIDAGDIAKRGGGKEASFWVDFQIGTEMGFKTSGPLMTPSSQKGTHGYFPDHPEMRATFIVAGPGVKAKGSLGDIDMRDIAPTVARLLDVSLPSATGKPLF